MNCLFLYIGKIRNNNKCFSNSVIRKNIKYFLMILISIIIPVTIATLIISSWIFAYVFLLNSNNGEFPRLYNGILILIVDALIYSIFPVFSIILSRKTISTICVITIVVYISNLLISFVCFIFFDQEMSNIATSIKGGVFILISIIVSIFVITNIGNIKQNLRELVAIMFILTSNGLILLLFRLTLFRFYVISSDGWRILIRLIIYPIVTFFAIRMMRIMIRVLVDKAHNRFFFASSIILMLYLKAFFTQLITLSLAQPHDVVITYIVAISIDKMATILWRRRFYIIRKFKLWWSKKRRKSTVVAFIDDVSEVETEFECCGFRRSNRSSERSVTIAISGLERVITFVANPSFTLKNDRFYADYIFINCITDITALFTVYSAGISCYLFDWEGCASVIIPNFMNINIIICTVMVIFDILLEIFISFIEDIPFNCISLSGNFDKLFFQYMGKATIITSYFILASVAATIKRILCLINTSFDCGL